jgi:hypothetical protein
MPNKTADLVMQWADFEAAHPDAQIEDFCRFYLIRQKEEAAKAAAQPILPDDYTKMARIVGRLARMHVYDAMPSLKAIGLSGFEEFTYLNSILLMMEPRKTDVIFDNMQELSSGLLILDRLKKKGFIQEYDDSQDRRSKRLKLTQKGKKKLDESHQYLQKVNRAFYGSISEDDLQLCIQLLNPLETKFSVLWQQNKRLAKTKTVSGNK